ncbi:MAG: hypothetical protein WB696_17635, partial [Chthoniobacterales bacterium]
MNYEPAHWRFSELATMIWDIALSSAAFLAILIAVRGGTWNAEAKPPLRRITSTGWAAIVIGVATFTISVLKSAHDEREKTARETETKLRTHEDANQILSELAPQLTFYKLMLENKKLPTSERDVLIVQQ